MSIAPGALRELHRIHRQLADLRERLARGPKLINAAEQNVKRAETDLATAKDTYRKARIASDDKQLQLKQREFRIRDLQGKLHACSGNREYQALLEQIAADEKANSVLSDEILEGLEQLDVLQANIGTADVSLVKGKEELAKVRAKVGEQQQGLETELARVTAELLKAEALLPADFKKDYERIAKARGENTLAPVEGEVCGGCYQMLTAQMLNDVHVSKPVFCKSCGSLLYLPER